MDDALLNFSNKLLEAIGEYDEANSYSDDNQEYTKLRTLVDVQNIIKDTLQKSIDEIEC